MKIGWLAFALFAGMMIPAQAAINARMRTFVGSPFYSALINFAVGALALVAVVLIMSLRERTGTWSGAVNAPWWAWCGGFIGVTIVVSGVVVVPKTGAAVFTAAIMIGQLAGALVLDHYGLFGLPQRVVTPSRIFGVLLLLLGIWFVQRK